MGGMWKARIWLVTRSTRDDKIVLGSGDGDGGPAVSKECESCWAEVTDLFRSGKGPLKRVSGKLVML